MRSIQKILLTLLAMIPASSISTVAYSKLNEMAGEEQNDVLQTKIRQAKRMLFANGQIATTVKEAKNRIASETGISNEDELNIEVQRQVQILVDHGIVEKNEQMIVSHIPSAW